MGPRSYERGIAAPGAKQIRGTAASMGPRSYERGISCSQPFTHSRPMASMGPRSYERGIKLVRETRLPRLRCFNGAAFLRTRNPDDERFAAFCRKLLQWGRVLTNAESQEVTYFLNDAAPLQWGRVLTNAESLVPMRVSVGWSDASMGPRSYERGIQICNDEPRGPLSASMGPRSYERGIRCARK